MFDQWLVVVNGTQLVDEIQRAPDDKISFVDAVGEVSPLCIFSDLPLINDRS